MRLCLSLPSYELLNCLVVFYVELWSSILRDESLTCSGLAWYPTYGMGFWIAWQGTLCTNWDGGWIGKVPRVQNRVWLILGVWHGLVDGMEWHLVYGLRLWMVWKGARSTIWDVVSTRLAEWDCGWLAKVPRVWNEIVDVLEIFPEYTLVDDC
jgi:hypothetical protein